MEDPAAGVADRVALRTLVEAYASAADRRDVDGFLALFTAEATLTVHQPDGSEGSTYAGHRELRAVPERLARYDQTLHLVHNHDLHVDGGRASGEALCTAHHLIGAGPDATDRVLTIRYLDRYELGSDRWRFASRDVRVQ